MKMEIEFRGQRADNKEWVYGSFINSVVKGSPFGYIAGNNIVEPIQVMRKTVGQYVGIKDKNGKKIFEGDIIKTKYGRLCRVVRVFLPSYVGWDLEVFDENNALTTKKPDEYDLYYKDNLEVIGNIFDKEGENE